MSEQYCNKGCGAPCGSWPHCPAAQEAAIVVHISPHYEPGACDHDWPETERGVDMAGCCVKCGMSFIRYIHTECP